MDQFSRTELLLGHEAMDKLKKSRVIVFGIGGVGGYVVEALARTGIGTLDIVDDDLVCMTNINRQIIATIGTVGRAKVDVCEERIKSISPATVVNKHRVFYLPETADKFDFAEYDYVVDAIDTVSAKLDIIERCYNLNVPIISAMGCGNRLDPTKLYVTDINKTEMDPLAKVIRKELRQRGVKKLKVVCSSEKPLKPIETTEISCNENCICPAGAERKCTDRRSIPGSTSFVPSAAGLIMASEVIRDLIQS